MSRLALEIADMFDELSGYERYADAYDVQEVRRRARAVERVRLWRIENPAKYRKLRRANAKRYAAKHREKLNAQRRETSAIYRAKNRAKVRAWNYKANRKRLDKAKAARAS